MLKEEYILFDLDCEDRKEVLETLANELIKGSSVKESFKQAVIEREENFPTGLPASAFDVAIPHTVGSHVNEPAIAVGILKHPVEFMQMGSPGIILYPKIVMMLAINDPNKQLALLKKIMAFLQNKEVLQTIINAKNSHVVLNVLKENLE